MVKAVLWWSVENLANPSEEFDDFAPLASPQSILYHKNEVKKC
jgi:hypothetical protein